MDKKLEGILIFKFYFIFDRIFFFKNYQNDTYPFFFYLKNPPYYILELFYIKYIFFYFYLFRFFIFLNREKEKELFGFLLSFFRRSLIDGTHRDATRRDYAGSSRRRADRAPTKRTSDQRFRHPAIES